MPFIPNIEAVVTQSSGEFDGYGQRKPGKQVKLRIAVVTLRARRDRTSVRTDSSASRSNAAEIEAAVRLLFPRTFKPKIGDKVEVAGVTVRVTSVFPRIAIAGYVDHFQGDGDYWQEGA